MSGLPKYDEAVAVMIAEALARVKEVAELNGGMISDQEKRSIGEEIFRKHLPARMAAYRLDRKTLDYFPNMPDRNEI